MDQFQPTGIHIGRIILEQLGPMSLPFDTTYYISVQVQGDVEMSRQMVAMSPYSASSDIANYAKAAAGDSKWTFLITDTADTTSISTIDPAGVALVGVQELIKENQSLRRENEEMWKKLSELERRLSELEKSH